ncbi:MAG: NAD(+) diphosphatase [Methanosphaera sp.]|nr:NAD(+) diphosphatase [Methanosphaera sp.]
MKCDVLYDNYMIDFSLDYCCDDEAYYFIFNNRRELYLDKSNTIPIVTREELNIFDVNFILYIGVFKHKPCFVVNVYDDDKYTNLYEFYNINKEDYQMARRAVLVNDWYNSNQYCGHCGTKTVLDDNDMMLKCPSCGQVHYTRIAPAIIVTIVKDDKLLMAKHKRHAKNTYALIAGFVEAGESIEQTVHREVAEEVGLKIKNLQYVDSQSWPFPNSLMLGFTAEYDSGTINVDEEEITDAKWFSADEIEPPVSDISISAYLINKFIEEYK